MTNKEFNKLTRQAWKQYPQITEGIRLELLKTYVNASELVKIEVIRAERLGLSELTITAKNAISEQLDRGVALLSEATEKAIASGIVDTLDIETNITNTWINSAAKEAGLTAFNMAPLNAVVREKVLTLTIARQFEDGYLLSERIWESASLYKTDMSRVINLGLAQGKDNITIAKALTKYIKGGKDSLIAANVYGKIIRGNGGLYSRLSQNVDYRALRLIRSEEQMSLQAAQLLRGEDNPGGTGYYNWVENSFVAFNCICPSLAANGPYTVDTIPSYPHPNCLCTIEQILRDRAEFVADLKSWSNGGSVPYMEDWYSSKYLLTK